MSATRPYGAVRQHPSYDQWLRHSAKRWKLVVDGKEVPLGTDWEVRGPVGSVGSRVLVDEEGAPTFDRPEYTETPNVNVVAWGRDHEGRCRMAVIRQPRPHADEPGPENRDRDGHPPVMFGQIVMGFLDRVVGADMFERYEEVVRGATREASEEAGASLILSVELPSCPWQNPNPTFVATWSDLVFLEVDLARLQELKATRSEPIYSAEFIPVCELLQRIREGRDDAGAYYRSCTANAAWMTFFATHPELFLSE